MNQEQGIVKWFSPEKGFGFIKSGDVDNIFVHYSGISGTGFKSLSRGQKVVFKLDHDHRGSIAVEVCLKNN
ncbi:MAG: cold shock domain-containing protein [Actinomycetia bacterium]|nr:cold shock domain-containing protein [Actinomycetes bacterium]